MTAAEALRTGRAAGVEIALDGDDLVLEASSPPPEPVLEALSRNKAGIVGPAASRWRWLVGRGTGARQPLNHHTRQQRSAHSRAYRGQHSRSNRQREREIVGLRSQGKKLREIGERYGISISRVSRIIRRVKHENGGDKNA